MYQTVLTINSILAWLLCTTFLFVPVARSQVSDGSTNQIYAVGPRGNNFEHVNLYNGHLTFKLPLNKVMGRGGLEMEGPSVSIETTWTTGWFSTEFITSSYPNGGVISKVNNGRVSLTHKSWGYQERCYYSPTQWNEGVNRTHSRLVFTTPDGTEINLKDVIHDGAPVVRQICTNYRVPRGFVFVGEEDSGITFVSDTEILDPDGYGAPAPTNLPNLVTGVLKLKDGTKYRFNSDGSVFIYDRNGNVTKQSDHIDPTLGRIVSLTDSLGRVISSRMEAPVPTDQSTFKDYINFKGIDGVSREVKVNRTLLQYRIRADLDQQVRTLSELFPGMLVPYWIEHVFNPAVISTIDLPDGRQFKFFYNNHGELARVEYPEGGAVEYEHEFGVQPSYNTPAHRRIKEKRIYPTGGTGSGFESKTNYTYWYGVANPSPAYFGEHGRSEATVETKNSSSNVIDKVKHYFYGNPQAQMSFTTHATFGLFRYWQEGIEYKTESFDVSGTANNVLRRVEKTWAQNTPSWWTVGIPYAAPPNSPKLQEIKTTLVDSGEVTRQVFAYDQYNNQTDVWEYYQDAAATETLYRRQHTDYVNDPAYTGQGGAHLRSLPLVQWISTDYNGSNKVSFSAFEYDNYTTDSRHAPLVGRSNASGHDTTNYGTGFTTRGNLTQVTSYANAANQTEPVVASSQYDILGNIVKAIDGRGNASLMGYDDRFGSPDGESRSNAPPAQLNGQQTFAYLTSTTNALGWTAYYQFEYHTGSIINFEDVDNDGTTAGTVSKIVYNDILNRPTQAVAAVGTALEQQATIQYDDANHKVTTFSDLNSLNDNLLKSESFHDGFGRVVENRQYEAGGGYIAVKKIPFAIVQDPETFIWRAGSKTSNPYRPGLGEQPVWTTTLSDEFGRPIKIITPDGAIAKAEYSGNTKTVTDQAGKARRMVTDALGRLNRVDEPTTAGLGTLSTPNQPTYYTYDVLNNLLQVQQNGTSAEQCGGTTTNCLQSRTFTYDSLSRVKQAGNPEAGAQSYQYDNNGNLTQRTDARGVVTTYVYDALNRVTSRSYSAPANLANYSPTLPVTYTYDSAPNARGLLTKVTTGDPGNPFSVTEYTEFERLGRIKKSKQTTDGLLLSEMTYTYNLVGSLVEQKYPSGRVVKNTLQSDGSLATVESAKTPTGSLKVYANNFIYTAAGAVSSMRLGNGRWESAQYNNRLQPIQIGLGTSQNATNLLKLDYEYGTLNLGTGEVITGTNNGNVAKQTINVPTTTQGGGFTATQYYAYDSLNRLQIASENFTPSNQPTYNLWKQTFTYDRYSNRNFDEANTTTLPKNCLNGGVYVVCPGDRKVLNPSFTTSDNRIALDQDNDQVNDYAFDAAGNVTKDASGKTFVYDAENKQTEIKNAQNQVIGQYYYDGDGRRVKKYGSGAAAETTTFIYDAMGQLVAEYSNQAPEAPKIRYLSNDYLGSPRIATDSSGTVIARLDFRPFGEEIGRVNYGMSLLRKQFTGYERDKESDLDFAQARYYSYNLGRFTSADPIGGELANPQSLNKYSYVTNNPINLVDPLGLCGTTTGSLDGTKCLWLSRRNEDGVISYKSVSQKEYGDGSGFEGWTIVEDPSGVTFRLTGLNGTYANDAEYQELMKNGTIVGLGENGRFVPVAQTEVTILDDEEEESSGGDPDDNPLLIGGLNPISNPITWRNPWNNVRPDWKGGGRGVFPMGQPGGVPSVNIPQMPGPQTGKPSVGVPQQLPVPKANPNNAPVPENASTGLKAALVVARVAQILARIFGGAAAVICILCNPAVLQELNKGGGEMARSRSQPRRIG